MAGLREQPDPWECFKKALGLEEKKTFIHPKTFSRLDKFTGQDGQWQEWIFNLIMTFKKLDTKLGEALERIIMQCKGMLTPGIIEGIVADDGLTGKYKEEVFSVLCELT